MKKLKLNYGSNVEGLFELEFLKGLDPVKDEVIVLVPEQFKADTEKYLIEHLEAGGLFHVGVFGLGKLVHEFSLGFGLPQSHLSTFGKSLMLMQILKELRPKLEIYRTRLSRGLVNQLLSMLDALRLEGLTASELEELASRLIPTQTLLIKKTREVALILKEYEQGIRSSHPDDITLIELLIEELLAGSPRKDLHLIVEGFNGMSRQEMRLVAALSHHAGGSTFINILKSNEGVLKTYSDKFVEGLKQAFYEIGDWEFHIEEVLAPQDVKNQRAALFSNIFSHNRKKFEVSGLNIVKCVSREDELSFIALDILKKMREEGAKWSDFALITNSLDLYQKHIYKILGDYQIPYFVDEKFGVADFSFCAFIVSALESVRTAFSKRAMVRFLKYSSHLELPRKKMHFEDYKKAYEERQKAYFNTYSKMEIYAKKYGIDHDMWLRQTYLSSFFSSLPDSEEMSLSYYSLVKKLEALSMALKEASNFEDMLGALQSFIEKSEVLERLKKLKALYQNLYDEEKSRRLAAEELAIEDLLNQLVMLGSFELSEPDEFIDLVISALKDHELSLPPPALDTIVLGTAARSRLIGVKYLYFIGCNEGLLPSKAPSNVFFSENEMIKLQEQSFTALKRSKNFMDKEVFDIYEKVAFAEAEVYFTYAAYDESSEELGPSYWLKSISRQGRLEIRKIDPPTLKEIGEAGIMKKYLDSLLLQHKGRFPKERLEEFNLSPESRVLLLSFLDTYLNSKRDIRAELNQDNTEKFKSVFKNISVSKLESHASCPYQFFVSYILSPKEMPEETLDKRSFGSMMHKVLELFVAAYMGAADKTAFRNEAMTIFYDLLHKEMGENPSYKYNKVERQKMELGKSYFEFLVPMLLKHFDTDYLRAVSCEYEIREDRGDFELRGKVDRVDVFEIAGEKYYRVIDYKSSDKGFEADKFSYGIQIQLPLYLQYFIRGGSEWGEGKPLGFAYSSLEEKLENLSFDDSYDEEKVKENYRLKGKFIKDLSIFACMEGSILETRKSTLVQSVSMKKKDNEWDGRKISSLMSAEAFEALFASLDSLVAKLSASLSSANIEIMPYKLKSYEPCSYCRYQNICKFDGLRYQTQYRTEPFVPVPDVKA